MVDALERARRHLVPGGVLVCIQPRRKLRPLITVTAPAGRQPAVALIKPSFEPLISAAEAVIDGAVADGRLELIRKTNRQFKVRLKSPAELRRYMHLGQSPLRFPPEGRERLRALWRSRAPGSQIEVTEFMAIIAMRRHPVPN